MRTFTSSPSLVKELVAAAWAEGSIDGDDISLTSNRNSKEGRLRRIVRFFTHLHPYVKLSVLMVMAVVHGVYLCDFLEKFKAYEGLARQVEDSATIDVTTNSNANTVLYVMRALIDYKKNLWMTVGAMSVCVATCAYSILLQHNQQASNASIFAVAFVDFFSFLCVPVLLLTRLIVASHLHMHIPSALLAAQDLVNPTHFINQLKCSITPREALPLCSDLMMSSIFPVKLLEYLLILCVLTAAYIGLAYLIQWCIRHFFPPSAKLAEPPKLTLNEQKAKQLYSALPPLIAA